MTEANHEVGRVGVRIAQRWLESTGRFSVPLTAYDIDLQRREIPPQLRKRLLPDGSYHSYDAGGQYFNEDHSSARDVWIEVKNYRTESGLGLHFKRFVAGSYSAFLQESEYASEPRWEFMFITMNPFDASSYHDLCSADGVKRACEHEVRNREGTVTESFRDKYLAGRAVDMGVAAQVAERLWVKILGPKIERIHPGRDALGAMQQHFSNIRNRQLEPRP